MNSRARLTPFGAFLVVLLVAGLVALFFAGSHTVQAVGFIVVLIIALILIAENAPRMRIFSRSPFTPPSMPRNLPEEEQGPPAPPERRSRGS